MNIFHSSICLFNDFLSHLFEFIFSGCPWAYHVYIYWNQLQIYISLFPVRYGNITSVFVYFLFLLFMVLLPLSNVVMPLLDLITILLSMPHTPPRPRANTAPLQSRPPDAAALLRSRDPRPRSFSIWLWDTGDGSAPPPALVCRQFQDTTFHAQASSAPAT